MLAKTVVLGFGCGTNTSRPFIYACSLKLQCIFTFVQNLWIIMSTFSYTIFIFVTFITHYPYFSVISAMHYTKRRHQYWYLYALCQSGSKLGIIRMEDWNLITSPHFSLLTRQFTVWYHITQNYLLSIFLSSCNTLGHVGLSEFLLIFRTQIFTKAKLN